MKIYMGYDKLAGSCEGAILIFANNYKEAKKIGYSDIMFLFGSDYIDVGIRKLKNSNHLIAQANKDLLKKNIPHAIDSPKTCPKCKMWGGVIGENGCSFCN